MDGERQILGAATALLATPDEAGDVSVSADKGSARKVPAVEVRALPLDSAEFAAFSKGDDASRSDQAGSDEDEPRGAGALSRLVRKLGLS